MNTHNVEWAINHLESVGDDAVRHYRDASFHMIMGEDEPRLLDLIEEIDDRISNWIPV